MHWTRQYVIKGHCIICALPPETAPENITWSEETFRFRDCMDCPTHCRVERQPETAEEIEALLGLGLAGAGWRRRVPSNSNAT